MAALTRVRRWFQQKPTRLQQTCAMQSRLLRALMMLFATHAPPCRYGSTPLKEAMTFNKADVIALLRSVGAPE
jgi:hypothetical protein